MPAKVQRALERFKKAYGPRWEAELERLLEEEARRREAKKELSAFLAKVSGRSKLTEEEIFRRLEGRP